MDSILILSPHPCLLEGRKVAIEDLDVDCNENATSCATGRINLVISNKVTQPYRVRTLRSQGCQQRNRNILSSVQSADTILPCWDPDIQISHQISIHPSVYAILVTFSPPASGQSLLDLNQIPWVHLSVSIRPDIDELWPCVGIQ